jgi:hypothetical protein
MTQVTWQIVLIVLAPAVNLAVILWWIQRPRRPSDVFYHPQRHDYDDTH